jgi:hypothetical protein
VLGAGLLAALSISSPEPQTAPPAPARQDAAASEVDAAALGFLTTVVDKRVYSLEGAGAAKLTGTARVRLELLRRDPELRSTEFDLALRCDYASGEVAIQPASKPDEIQTRILPVAMSAAQNAFSFLPSRSASPWKVTFAQDVELVRLDYRARQAKAQDGAGFSEWHRADGTPVRRRVRSFRPVGEAAEPIEQEVLPSFVERKGRLLLSELKPRDPQSRFSWSFEYEEKDGFFVLKKLVQADEGFRLTLEFTVAVERRAGR